MFFRAPPILQYRHEEALRQIWQESLTRNRVPVDQDPLRADLTPEWNTHRLLSDAGILDECLQRAERIMLERRLAAARDVVADLEAQLTR